MESSLEEACSTFELLLLPWLECGKLLSRQAEDVPTASCINRSSRPTSDLAHTLHSDLSLYIEAFRALAGRWLSRLGGYGRLAEQQVAEQRKATKLLNVIAF